MQKIRSRVLLLLLGVALAGLLVEALLQVASFAAWSQARRALGPQAPRVAAAAGERVVLCVGDSNTYGAGASSPAASYPARLQKLLDQSELPVHWTVVNRGWPGRNSAEVLHHLPALLAEVAPDYVVILVGVNNGWSDAMMDHPPPSPAAARVEAHQPWAWRWRTRRLLRILLPSDAPPRTRAADAPRPAPGSAGSKRTGSSVEGSEKRAAARETPLLRALLRAWDLWDERRAAESLDLVDHLISDVLASHERRAWELLGHLFLRQARPARAVELLPRAVERFGRTPDLCLVLARAHGNLGHGREAEQWIRDALALQPDAARHHHALARIRSQRGDLEGAAAAAARAYTLDGDATLLRQRLRPQVAAGLSEDALDRALERAGVTPEGRAEIRVAFSAAAASGGAQRERLRRDLMQMVLMADEAGARAVLLTYPHPAVQARAGPASAEAARLLGVPLVDVASRFRRLLAEADPRRYFVPDLHPNDAGYRLMAGQVQRALLELEARAAGFPARKE